MADHLLFPYGATYSPLAFEESSWERDLELMAQAEMTIIRVGDIGTWERIEVEEGKYDLAALERFYSLAAKYGLQIMIGTGSCTPPLWLAQKYPDVRIKSSRGELYPLGASYHWACIHHPAFLEASHKYIEVLSAFVVQQPNHFGWQITNEIGFPFNPTRESGDIDLYCYCDHSKEQFQEWMKEKYGSVERVTDAWTWSTSNFVYQKWEDLFPPEALPKTWSSVTRWLDWRLFWQQAFVEHAAQEHDWIREGDPGHPTSVNTFNFKGYDRFGTYTGLDQWKIAQVVDHIGYDLYPGSGNKLATRPEHSSIFLDHGRSVSRSAGSAFWVHEIESGPIEGWLLGPDHKTEERDIDNMCLECLGHDAKLMIFMPWREWEFMPLHWGALIDLEGGTTPRYQAAGVIGSYIKDNAEFLHEAQVPVGEIALLESKPNAIFLRGIGQEDQLFQAQRGAYRAFWEAGYRVDFITEEQLFSKEADQYRVIAAPLLGLISDELARALNSYVSQGGILIGFARMGTVDRRAWYHKRLPIPDLAEVFGLEKIEADHRDDLQIEIAGRSYLSWLNRDILFPQTGTQILAQFEDGLPAVTLHSYGKGCGLYFATQADSGYLEPASSVLKEALEIIQGSGIRPYLSFGKGAGQGRKIDPHLLETPDRTEIFISNYALEKSETEIILRETNREVKTSWKGIANREEFKVKQSAADVRFTVKLAGKEVEIISIEWQ